MRICDAIVYNWKKKTGRPQLKMTKQGDSEKCHCEPSKTDKPRGLVVRVSDY